jgi:hypothetical protein
VAGAVLGGCSSAALFATAGGMLPTGVLDLAAVSVAAYAFVWHARDARAFRGSLSGIQANRRLATQTRAGRLYFGFLLGFGLATYMTTPLVYSLALYVAALGMPAGLVAGAGFGLGRSRPIVTGLRARGRLTPAAVAAQFACLTGADRVIGCAIGAAIVFSLAAGGLHGL